MLPTRNLALYGGGSEPLSVRALLDAYLRHCHADGTHCDRARADRIFAFNLFCAEFGDCHVAELKAFHLRDWIASHPKWKSTATRRAKANYIRAAFNWAVRDERIDRNPFAKVVYAEAERRPELPDEIIDRIARAGSKPFDVAVRFLRLTGCRLTELCEAQWADIDLDRGYWIIQRHKSRRFTGKPKCVALVPEAVRLLRNLAGLFPDGPIFVNTRGTPWTRATLGKAWQRIKKRLKIETRASLHGIRHRAATAAIVAGAPIKLISQQLGHASVVVTERYYAHIDGQIDAIRNAMDLGSPKP